MHQTTQVSRGDLLRCLKRCETTDDQQLSASLLGFVWEKSTVIDKKPEPAENEEKQAPAKPRSKPEDNKPQDKLPSEIFYAVSEQKKQQHNDTDSEGLPPALQQVSDLQAEDLRPLDENAEPLPIQSMVKASHINPYLKQSLSYALGKQLDIARLIKQTTRLQTLHKLPYKPRQIPAGRCYVLLDLNKRMLPFWDDAHALCAAIIQKQGKTGLDIRIIDDNPGGQYRDRFDPEQALKDWRPLHSPSVVFIISDMGQSKAHDGENSPVQQRWVGFLRQLKQQGHKVVALSPLQAHQQNLAIHKLLQQSLWQKRGDIIRHKPHQCSDSYQQQVQRVLGLISFAVHIEPILLRAILNCLPLNESSAGLEASVYLHPDIVWGYTAISLHPDKRQPYQSLFKQEQADLQQQVIALVQQHHSRQFPVIWAEEVINLTPLVDFKLDQREWAEEFMQRFTRSFSGQRADMGMAQYARRHIQRQSSDSKRQHKQHYISTLYGLAYRESLRNGDEIPAEYDARQVMAVVSQPTELKHYQLYQQGENLRISEQGTAQGDFTIGLRLAEFSTAYDSIELIQQNTSHSLPLRSLPMLIPLRGHNISLHTGQENITISAIKKPAWADAMQPSQHTGLEAIIELNGNKHYFDLQPEQKSNWSPRSGDNTFGFDQYGIYAGLQFKGVTQRFRFIKPTTFLMGSPADEVDRFDSEKQHQVTLSQGYWMADSTVTQALWQAVMGDNPSYFKGKQNPAEEISWKDAQVFIQELKKEQPQLDIRLPSEAEWENACRAGTSTQFSFGENISPAQVNYDGNYPYNNAAEGEYREKTVAVKSLLANAWGLHEMHGNVWEWCQDWYGKYPDQSVTDPAGAESGDNRVLRGGSWINFGRRCRSAYRLRFTPDYRGHNTGFRLASGHLSYSQEPTGKPQGQARRGAAPDPVDGQVAGAKSSSLMRKILDKLKGR